MTLTTTEAAVLGLLRGGELSGYDLRKDVERSIGYFWAPAKTQIYATLPRLVEAGLATRRTVVQTDRPDKHLYAITEAGREALGEWVESGSLDTAQGRNVLLLKLSVAGPEHAEALLEQVRGHRAEAERLHSELVELNAAGEGAGPPFQHLTRRFGFFYVDALLRWADETEAELERVADGAAVSSRG